MSTPKHTTVILSDFAQAAKIELAPIYGLKNILSAGVLLFNSLPAEMQKRVITAALQPMPEGDLEKGQAVFDMLLDEYQQERARARRIVPRVRGPRKTTVRDGLK